MDKELKIVWGWSLSALATLALLLLLFFWVKPQYSVWSAGLEGKALFMRAEQEKKIQVEQARAELESAKLRAEAIQIVGKASKEYPEYRTQEFIGAFAEAVQSGAIDQIIYVPTENNIPIVERAR